MQMALPRETLLSRPGVRRFAKHESPFFPDGSCAAGPAPGLPVTRFDGR